MTKKQIVNSLFIAIVATICLGLIFTSSVQAQYWINLPPYNTLWPLWSPTLSPVNPLTGLPVPLVNSLTPNTILPIQPALTMDPSINNPITKDPMTYLLYNTPLGMAYFDPIWGINLWPPRNLLDPIFGTVPLPIDLSLIKGWSTLAPTSTTWLLNNVPIGNNAYYNAFSTYAVAYEVNQGGTLGSYPLFASLLNPAPAYTSLLTPGLILGLPF